MGFDFTTFLFELANFALLLWILQRVLYRPLREGVERRRAAMARERELAAEERAAAGALRAEAEERLEEVDRLRETIVADAREQAAKEEARILEHAREEAEAERERVQRTLEREREEALAWLREATVDNATEIAGRLLRDLLPEDADRVLLGALVASIPEQGDAFRAQASGARGDGPLVVELCAPRPLDDEVLATLRSVLEETLARPCRLSLREDPSLLAGVVLRVGDRVLDASVAGHLSALRERARSLVQKEGPRG